MESFFLRFLGAFAFIGILFGVSILGAKILDTWVENELEKHDEIWNDAL